MASSTGTGSTDGQPGPSTTLADLPVRTNSSKSSLPPPGQTLTGKQEHCMLLQKFLQAAKTCAHNT